MPTEGKYKAIAQAASPSRGVQDILESDDDDGAGPGPGAYFEGETSGFRIDAKPKRICAVQRYAYILTDKKFAE